jgi:phenylpropionate dioxygenase-like ring-hydroxylating dioxygenase large terminal subunit
MAGERVNETLTQVGPGTPMGTLMRKYWIPAAMSEELQADGNPMRLLLLGQRLVAFRDTSGRVGILDHNCPHRCASLFLGRNEENGLRCVYHGWKFDVDGNVLEMPNVPPNQLKSDAKARAYKVAERNGLIWVYLGDSAEVPPLPAIEATVIPDNEREIEFVQRDCNWLQALEGDIDTSHYDLLHMGMKKGQDFAIDDPRRFGVIHRDPEIVVQKTEWGMMYGAYRPADPGQLYWRIAHFMFPFWTLTPNRPFDRHISVRAWIPMDDTHTMSIRIARKNQRNYESRPRLVPNTTGWYGRWRPETTEDNDWGQDRDRQRTDSFAGIDGTHHQDQAVTESMGTITDRSKEYLVSSDMPIAVTRNQLLRAVQDMKNNVAPPGSANPDCYYEVRSGYYIALEKQDWISAYREQLGKAKRLGSAGL